ncbi:hypothetical protein KAU11_02230 [Candidatus Babeliales bacterium]|nr:hypothetical protein [Candidatus Babeliales bacterium]
MAEEKEKGKTKETSLLDCSMEWGKKNMRLLKGGALCVVGLFLVLNTYRVFLHIAFAMLGAVLIIYGLYELKFTPLPKVFTDFFKKYLKK